MIQWLIRTTAGKILSTFALSMMPVGELRVGLPYGIALGLPYWVALLASLVGNILPVPFIIVYIKRIFQWMRKHMKWLDNFVTKLEKSADLKGETVKKYGPVGLLLFVAIPLPGTGAWTGSLIAALLDMPLKKAVPFIVLGVCIAAGIMTAVTFGVISVI